MTICQSPLTSTTTTCPGTEDLFLKYQNQPLHLGSVTRLKLAFILLIAFYWKEPLYISADYKEVLWILLFKKYIKRRDRYANTPSSLDKAEF